MKTSMACIGFDFYSSVFHRSPTLRQAVNKLPSLDESDPIELPLQGQQ